MEIATGSEEGGRYEERSLMLPFATAPDVVRAEFRDAVVRRSLVDQWDAFVHSAFGSRVQQRFHEELQLLSDVCYYGLTTLRGSQTLGEEYTEIVQIHGFNRPSLTRRALLVLMESLSPYMLVRGVPLLQQATVSHPRLKYIRERLPDVLWFVGKYVLPFQLAVFYLMGRYYTLPKRFLGIRYLFSRRLMPGEERLSYGLLGILILIQLFFGALSKIAQKLISMPQDSASERDSPRSLLWAEGAQSLDYLVRESAEEQEHIDSTPVLQAAMRCTLCLGQRERTTATPCGHLFCWECICEWCSTKEECPLCRQSVRLPQLYPVSYFWPSD